MSDFGAPIAVPAISRCAHGVSSTKRCRNCAAVIEPPWRPPVFFTSANCESISLSYSGPSGIRQTRSPVASPTLVSRSANSSLLENNPAYSVPSATMIAPVSVARSTMNFGLNFFATYQSTSASTKRPSASVLMISMVWPDIRSDHDRAGECRKVDHEFRLELLRHIPEHIGQHQAPFGVGIDDLDGLAGHQIGP